jgi:hypothetical protein
VVESDEARHISHARRHRGQHHHGVDGVFHPGHAFDLPGHGPPVVEKAHHPLVALGAVSPHDGTVGARRSRPVDAPAVVVDPVFAQLLEFGAAPPGAGAAQTYLQDPGPLDTEVGLAAGPEAGVDP